MESVESVDSEGSSTEILEVAAIPISGTCSSDDISYLSGIIVANCHNEVEGDFTERIRFEISNSGDIFDIYPPKVTVQVQRWPFAFLSQD